jgi:hypothetical protein
MRKELDELKAAAKKELNGQKELAKEPAKK